jgi:hypothetical protein
VSNQACDDVTVIVIQVCILLSWQHKTELDICTITKSSHLCCSIALYGLIKKLCKLKNYVILSFCIMTSSYEKWNIKFFKIGYSKNFQSYQHYQCTVYVR